MSASAKQTAEELRKLKESLGEIIDQLNSSVFGLVGYDLSVMHGDLERVTANLKSAFDLEVGE
jgi:hypothetical protein